MRCQQQRIGFPKLIDVTTTQQVNSVHLPQKINAGEEIGTITVGGVTQKISAVEDLDLKAGSTLSVRLSKKFGGGIIDGNVPLYR